jgi:hypothetical protein
VPDARLAVFTAAVSVPLPEPDPGVIDSHETSSLAVQFRVPPTVLIVSDRLVGFAAPCVAANERLAELTLIMGVAGGGGVDGAVIRRFIPGISERSRPNALDPPKVPGKEVFPDAAAVSPVPVRDVLLSDVVPAELDGVGRGEETVPALPCTVLLERVMDVCD